MRPKNSYFNLYKNQQYFKTQSEILINITKNRFYIIIYLLNGLIWFPKTAHFFAQHNAKWITEKKERLGEAMSLISSRNWLEC